MSTELSLRFADDDDPPMSSSMAADAKRVEVESLRRMSDCSTSTALVNVGASTSSAETKPSTTPANRSHIRIVGKVFHRRAPIATTPSTPYAPAAACFKCSPCGHCAKSKHALRDHVKLRHPLKCRWCGIVNVDPDEITRHSCAEMGERRAHRCSRCTYAGTSSDVLRRHMYGTHGIYPAPTARHSATNPSTAGLRFACTVCACAYRSAEMLRKHRSRVHGEDVGVTGAWITNVVQSAPSVKCETKVGLSSEIGDRQRQAIGQQIIASREIVSDDEGVADGLFACVECSHVSGTGAGLRKHMSVHSADRPHKCRACDYAGKRSCDLRRHVRVHHSGSGGTRMQCAKCPFVAKSSYTLTAHMRLHAAREYKCDACELVWPTLDERRKHQNDAHPGLVTAKAFDHHCTECRLKYASSSRLVTHMAAVHASIIACAVCPFETRDTGELARHMRAEHPLTLACPLCAFTSTHQGRLNAHVRSHDGRPFKCDVCARLFNAKWLLTAHMMKHKTTSIMATTEYECDRCEFATDDETALNWHSVTHTISQSFECDACEFTSDDAGDLREHEETMHNRAEATINEGTTHRGRGRERNE